MQKKSLDPDSKAKGILQQLIIKDEYLTNKKSLKYLFEYLAYLYLKLTCHKIDGSYLSLYHNHKDYDTIINLVYNDAQTFRYKVEEYFKLQRNKLGSSVPRDGEIPNDMGSKEAEAEIMLQSPLQINDLMKKHLF